MPRQYGKTIMLREFRSDDIHGMRAWVNDDAVTRYLSSIFTIPNTFDQTRRNLDSILDGSGGVHLVIADPQSEEYLGQCQLLNIDHAARKAELSIVLKGDQTGRGIGSEAIELLLNLAFEQLNYNRVFLRVYAANERAIRCYESLGFAHEGRMREEVFMDGKYQDVLLMGILREEFRARHGG